MHHLIKISEKERLSLVRINEFSNSGLEQFFFLIDLFTQNEYEIIN